MSHRSRRTITATGIFAASLMTIGAAPAWRETTDQQQAAPTPASVMAAMTDADWRPLDPERIEVCNVPVPVR